MRKKSDRSYDTKPKTLKRSTLAILLFAAFCFSMFLGVTAGAMGLGSIYPQLNSIAQPVACPGHTMTHSQQVSEIGTTTYYAAKWFCVDENDDRTEISSNTIALNRRPRVWHHPLRGAACSHLLVLELKNWPRQERWANILVSKNANRRFDPVRAPMWVLY